VNEEVKARAFRIVEKREVSRKMLIDKLTEKGASPEDAQEVADRLCELRVIDDSRFAGMVVRHYAGKGYGLRRIQEELYRRGIDRELWDEALEELPEEDDSVYHQLCRRMRGEITPEAQKKAIAALQRRGFSWGEIRSALDRYLRENEE
jgi:regulatory protein